MTTCLKPPFPPTSFSLVAPCSLRAQGCSSSSGVAWSSAFIRVRDARRFTSRRTRSPDDRHGHDARLISLEGERSAGSLDRTPSGDCDTHLDVRRLRYGSLASASNGTSREFANASLVQIVVLLHSSFDLGSKGRILERGRQMRPPCF